LNPELCYFDPDSAGYRTLKGEKPVSFRVTAGKNYASRKSMADSLAAIPPPQPVKKNKVWESLLSWPAALGAGVLLLLGLVLIGYRKKQSSPASPLPPRPVPPGKIAREHFAEAGRLLKAGNPRAFYDELFKSLETYLSEALHLPQAQLTPTMVRARLTERKVPPARIEAILAVWSTCEQALFAGQPMAAEMEDTWHKAEESVKDLEKIR
jgi:hypothetical protein